MGRRQLTITTLLLYAVSVAAVTTLPIRVRSAEYWAQAGEAWWTVFHYVPGVVDGPSFVLNVIMFVPAGVLLPLLWPRLDALLRLAGYGLAASSTIEATQFVLGVTLGSRRTVDVNDLIANTAGALLGLVILRLAVPSRPARATCVAGTPPSPPPPA